MFMKFWKLYKQESWKKYKNFISISF